MSGPRIGGLVLAAGEGSRFEGGIKQLACYGGRLAHASGRIHEVGV